jgi:hypothetical protein
MSGKSVFIILCPMNHLEYQRSTLLRPYPNPQSFIQSLLWSNVEKVPKSSLLLETQPWYLQEFYFFFTSTMGWSVNPWYKTVVSIILSFKVYFTKN